MWGDENGASPVPTILDIVLDVLMQARVKEDGASPVPTILGTPCDKHRVCVYVRVFPRSVLAITTL